MDKALNNPQRLICHKTNQLTNQTALKRFFRQKRKKKKAKEIEACSAQLTMWI